MLDLTVLRDRIANGQDPDLYRGILSFNPQPPITPEVSETFMKTAKAVLTLYPDRVIAKFANAYDARVILIDFCEHPATTREDILLVIDGVNHDPR